LIAACTSFDVRVAHDPAVDPASFASWSWLPEDLCVPADQRLPDRHLERNLTGQVERILAAKGYARVPPDRADLYVNYRLPTDERENFNMPYKYRYDIVWARPERGSLDSYERGTLLIDVVDAHTKSLVWRGTGSSRLLTHASYEKRAGRLQDVIDQIL